MTSEDPTARLQQYLTVAQGYYAQHQWEDAAHYFRAALTAVPNHLQAALKLGEVLNHLERFEEALVVLEPAFQNDPKASRVLYSNALVGKAKQIALKDDETAITLCEQALQISPNHGQAYQINLSIWMRRADAALLHDDLETASFAYRQAGDTSRADHIETLYRWQIESELEKQARSLEMSGKWADAAGMYQKLLATAAKKEIKKSWEDAYQRCQEEEKLLQVFTAGLAAYKVQNWEEAKARFLELVNLRADYHHKEQWGAELLYLSVRASSSIVISDTPASTLSLAPGILSAQNVRRLVRLARLGNGQVHHIAFTPDQRYLVVSSSIGLYLYSTQAFERMRFIDTDAWVTAFAISPDSATIASGFEDGLIWLWRVFDGSPLRKMRGHNRQVNALSFSPDASWLASGSDDGFVRFWQTADGRTLQVLEGRLESVRNLAIAPDSSTLAVVATDAVVRLRRAPDGMMTHALSGHKTPVLHVAYAPNGKSLASGSEDGDIRIWNLKNGRLQGELGGTTQKITGLSYSPNGEYLAASNNRGETVLWNAASGKFLRTLPKISAPLKSLAFSPDSQQIAGTTEDQTVQIWHTEDGLVGPNIEEFTGSLTSLSFSRDGKTLAAGYQDGNLRLWAISRGAEIRKIRAHASGMMHITYSPDGHILASGGQDSLVRLWNSDTLDLTQSLTAHTSPITTLSFAPDGKILATGSADGVLKLWRMPEGSLIHSLSGTGGAVRQVSFSPRGAMVAATADDGSVRIWLASAGHLIYTLRGNWGKVTSLCFSHNGAELICGTADGLILVWRTTTDWPFLKRFQAHKGLITRLAVSPVNGLLAVGTKDNTISLWTIGDESHLNTLEGSGRAITDLSFSPDGTLLATAAEEGVIRLWGVVGG
ncbi:MAG: tetratricopeptide repeat protein [Anaerolineales bacterium]|nr:tetratricopeptide repeat protein [Anaerolineales bacterium]